MTIKSELLNNEMPCTYTQLYWLDNSNELSDTLHSSCGIPWKKIMLIDTVKMAIPSNMYWVIAFHQYVSVLLNIDNIEKYQQTKYNMTAIDNEYNVSMLIHFIGDSLARGCNNINQWPSQYDDRNLIYNALSILRRFNNGEIGPGRCKSEFSNTTTSIPSTFYSFNTPDMIIIPKMLSNSRNNSIIYSLLTLEYKFRQVTLSSSVIACFILIPILCCIIACIVNKRRQFSLNKSNKKKLKKKDLMIDPSDLNNGVEFKDMIKSTYKDENNNNIKVIDI